MERHSLDRSPLRPAAATAHPFAPPTLDGRKTATEAPPPAPMPRSQIDLAPIDWTFPPLVPPVPFGQRPLPPWSLLPPLQLPRLPSAPPAPAARDTVAEGPMPLPPLRLSPALLRPSPGVDPNALIDWRSIRHHYHLRGVPFGAADGDSFVAEYRRIDRMYRTLGFDRDLRLGPFKLDRNAIINLGLGMQAEQTTSRDHPNFMDRDAAMRKIFYPDEKRFVFSFPSIRF